MLSYRRAGLIKRSAMKAYWGMGNGGVPPPLLTSAVYECERYQRGRAPGTHAERGCGRGRSVLSNNGGLPVRGASLYRLSCRASGFT